MKLLDYIRDTRGELKHVSWPSRQQAINATILVVVMSLIVSLFLGLFDTIFGKIIAALLS